MTADQAAARALGFCQFRHSHRGLNAIGVEHPVHPGAVICGGQKRAELVDDCGLDRAIKLFGAPERASASRALSSCPSASLCAGKSAARLAAFRAMVGKHALTTRAGIHFGRSSLRSACSAHYAWQASRRYASRSCPRSP
jgi:hypothetical protein